jgi:GTPase
MVAANNGLIGMSKEHLGIALALNVPVGSVIDRILEHADWIFFLFKGHGGDHQN